MSNAADRSNKTNAVGSPRDSERWISFLISSRGATEQSTLAERGKFHENSIPILRVDYSCVHKYLYNNLLKRLRFLGNKNK